MRPLLSLAPPSPSHKTFLHLRSRGLFIWLLHITWARRSSVHTSSIHRFPLQNCNRGLTGNRSGIKDSCFYNVLVKHHYIYGTPVSGSSKLILLSKYYHCYYFWPFARGCWRWLNGIINWVGKWSIINESRHTKQQDFLNTRGKQSSSINHIESTRTV